MNYNNRINFYLGNILNNNTSSDDIKYNNDCINKVSNKLFIDKKNVYSIYDEQLYNLLCKSNNLNKNFYFYRGDNRTTFDKPTLCKNRLNNYNSIILRCMEFSRHWGNFYNKPTDIPFNEKINKVFWRGATTGEVKDPASRFELMKWYNKNDNIDIGFSLICQNKNDYNKFLKNKVTITEMLKYKYILSVQGNDKDSGLQWKLNSNSLILMSKPTVTSWLMETTLIPNYHYVLLKDDYSDLLEKYQWCENNKEKCLEIIKNANNFMKQFEDNEREEQLEIDVINNYIKIIENNK